MILFTLLTNSFFEKMQWLWYLLYFVKGVSSTFSILFYSVAKSFIVRAKQSFTDNSLNHFVSSFISFTCSLYPIHVCPKHYMKALWQIYSEINARDFIESWDNMEELVMNQGKFLVVCREMTKCASRWHIMLCIQKWRLVIMGKQIRSI